MLKGFMGTISLPKNDDHLAFHTPKCFGFDKDGSLASRTGRFAQMLFQKYICISEIILKLIWDQASVLISALLSMLHTSCVL